MRFPLTRRRWLKAAAGLAVGGGIGGGIHFARQQHLRVGLIGAGMRGRQLAEMLRSTRLYPLCAHLVAVCDVYKPRAETTCAEFGVSGAEVMSDARRLLERDDVEAVFIATPDHMHTPLSLAALAAGKHVYCEKPMTLTVEEGQRLIAAVNASQRTFLVGTQQRSSSRFHTACNLIRNGRIGRVERIEISLPENPAGGPFAAEPVPDGLDWNAWLGNAPPVPYCSQRFQNFRSWYDYGGGSIADWGAHHLDIVHWALDRENSGPTEISGEAKSPQIKDGYNAPAQYAVEMKYAAGPTVHLRTSRTDSGILFIGDADRLYVNRRRVTGRPVEQLSANPLPAEAVLFGHARSYWNKYHMAHIRHFLDCVRRGDRPISDVASQHRSASACHLANIALRLNRTVRWNPTTETFLDDPRATAMISRRYA